MENEKVRCKIDVVIGYSQLSATDLAEILVGIQNWLIRSWIAWSISGFKEWSDYHFQSLGREVKGLVTSYMARYRMMRYNIKYSKTENPFQTFLDEDVFERWILEDIPPGVVEIDTIQEGQSIVVSLAFVAAALITNYPPFDYSMMKDMARHLASSLRSAIPHNRPANTLEHIPTVIEKIAKKRTIKKFHIIIEGDKVDIQAEYERGHSSKGKGSH